MISARISLNLEDDMANRSIAPTSVIREGYEFTCAAIGIREDHEFTRVAIGIPEDHDFSNAAIGKLGRPQFTHAASGKPRRPRVPLIPQSANREGHEFTRAARGF